MELENKKLIKNRDWEKVYQRAIEELENFIAIRRYKKTPYEIKVPDVAINEIRDMIIKPLLSSFNLPKIKRYFKQNKIENKNLGIYFEYRYLLFYYHDYIKELYLNSKRCPYFYLKNIEFNPKKKSYITYKLYPKDFENIQNTIKNIPAFEHNELFDQRRDSEQKKELFYQVENLKRQGIAINMDYSKQLFLEVDSLIVGNRSVLDSFLDVSDFIFEKEQYSYNLYDYIYDEKIIDFLDKYEYYFRNCRLNVLKEFYEKTGLKLKYLICDSYREFTFDIYGIIGTDMFGAQTYIYGEYLKKMDEQNFDEYDRMQDDYDLRIYIEVPHIDYDDDNNIYYQYIYEKWDPYYEDAMCEEDKENLTNDESEKIYLFLRQ